MSETNVGDRGPRPIERVLVKFKIGVRVPGYTYYGEGEVAGFPAQVAKELVKSQPIGADKVVTQVAEYVDEDGRPAHQPVVVIVAGRPGQTR